MFHNLIAFTRSASIELVVIIKQRRNTLAELTIKLVYNLNTGKQDVFIDFVSEDDALPIEHEKDHRKVIEKLLGQGILKADELGEVKINRLAGQSDLNVASQTVLGQNNHLKIPQS